MHVILGSKKVAINIDIDIDLFQGMFIVSADLKL